MSQENHGIPLIQTIDLNQKTSRFDIQLGASKVSHFGRAEEIKQSEWTLLLQMMSQGMGSTARAIGSSAMG